MVHNGTGENSPTRPVRVVGYRHVVYCQHRQGRGNPDPPLRGSVYGLSKGSRRRLMRFMAECNNSPTWLVTLTYPSRFPTPAEAKGDLKVWSQRMQRIAARAGIDLGILWRMELQARGAPHFHCLLWLSGSPSSRLYGYLDSRSISLAQETWRPFSRKRHRKRGISPGSRLDWLLALSCTWYDRVRRFDLPGESSLANSVDLRAVDSYRNAAAYVAKYLTKDDRGPLCNVLTGELVPLGRVWGTNGNKDLMDRRVLGMLHLPPVGEEGNWLQRLWKSLGNGWGQHAEAEGWSSYGVYLQGDGFWIFLNELFRQGIFSVPRVDRFGLSPPS